MMRRDIQRIQDVLDAIRMIEKYTQTGRDDFDANELIRIWCLKHIEIIGEAIAHVSDSFRKRYPDIPWRQITAMRNQLIHGYFGVDWEIVWDVVDRDLPLLKVSIEKILQIEGET